MRVLAVIRVRFARDGRFRTRGSHTRKEEGTEKHIPLIAMTAHALKGDQERCRAAGMDRYVSKLIRVSELFATLERPVPGERKRQTDEEVPEASGVTLYKIL